MTSADLTDNLQTAEVLLPVLKALAATFDHEFQRREPTEPTIHAYAAQQLGVAVGELFVCSESVDPSTAHSVGCWLLEAQMRTGAPYVGGRVWQQATTVVLPGADGEVRAFSTATVVLRPGVLSASSCVVRIVADRFDDQVEVIGRREDAADLARAFTAFLRARRKADSPYLRGSYRVSGTQRGLLLKAWTPAPATRALLKLSPSVWETIDRGVHRVLALADDLNARGLGTSAGVLLVGPPGTGKTQLGTVIANELLGSATVFLPDTNVTAHWLTELFDLASNHSPCLILMDDLDLIAGERGAANPHRLREFLNVMDGGLADRSGVVVVASTNDHRKVDKAARRSSRFDTIITMEAPNAEGRRAILDRYLAWCDAHLDLDAVVRATDGATGADIKELVRTTVLETGDNITTQALLAQAVTGRWQRDSTAVGDYL